MANYGFTNVCGIDAFLEADKIYNVKKQEVAVRRKTVFDLNETFDFIMLHHALEHIPNQHEFFEKLSSLMHTNSMLLINIPIIDSYEWDKYKMAAFQLKDVPRHYYLHSVKSIEMLAEQQNLQIKYKQFYGKYKNSKQSGLCCFYLTLKDNH